SLPVCTGWIGAGWGGVGVGVLGAERPKVLGEHAASAASDTAASTRPNGLCKVPVISAPPSLMLPKRARSSPRSPNTPATPWLYGGIAAVKQVLEATLPTKRRNMAVMGHPAPHPAYGRAQRIYGGADCLLSEQKMLGPVTDPAACLRVTGFLDK